MDDYHINTDNPQIAQGISGIPEIFTTLYAEENNMSYGYRPLVRTSFAIEYQFTSGLSINPYISHFINILLYTLAILLLYKVLRRLLNGYNPWFPFLVTLLFMAHPTHTEVVASLKNRDVILNFLFTFIAIWQFVRWIDVNKTKHLIFGMISFLLALLSKESAITQLAIFPLILYFFTNIKLKKLGVFTSIAFLVVLSVFLFRWFILPETERGLKMWENPLVDNDSIMLHLGTASYIIGHYIKLLFIPFPLAYYYGYNMIPLVGFTNPLVILSTTIILGMLVYAIMKLKTKSIVSFAILYFFVNMAMYSNIVAPVPGIVADRFLFFATLSFAIIIVWILFKLFKVPLTGLVRNNKQLIWVSLLVILIVAPFGYFVRKRNKQWRTQYSLYEADMPKLSNSVKANSLYAGEIMKSVNQELSKPVNPYKFIMRLINNAEKHFNKAVELDSTHYTSWNNLGIIYSKIHGNQALIRMRSYINEKKPDKVEEERINAEEFFSSAIGYYKKAIEYNPKYGSAYFNLGNTFEMQMQYDSSIVYFRKAADVDGGELVSMSRLANAYFMNHQTYKAIEKNKEIILAYPNSDMPYINLGNYAFKAKDTINGLMYFKKAIAVGTKPNVGKFISGYYYSKGDIQSANYYQQKSYEAEKLEKNKRN